MRGAIITLMLLVGGAVVAAPLYTHQEVNSARGYGTKISAYAMAGGAVWTGWIDTSIIDNIVLDINTTDADNSMTRIDMRCETSRSGSTANDSGRDVCSRATATGVSTYTCPHSWRLAPSASQDWQWSLSDVGAPYVNCVFSVGAGAADATIDTLTVYVRGITP